MGYKHRTKSGKIKHFTSKAAYQRSLEGFFANQNGDKSKTQKKISKAKTKTQRKPKPKSKPKTISKKSKKYVYISPYRPLGAWIRGDVGRDNLIEIDAHKLVTNKKLSVDTMKKLEIHPENPDDYGKLTYEQLVKGTGLESNFGLKELSTYSNEDLDKYLSKDILSQVKGTDIGVIYSQDDIQKVIDKQIALEKKKPKKMKHKNSIPIEKESWGESQTKHGKILNQFKFTAFQDGSFSTPVLRAGSEFGDPSREGTWYSVPKYEEDKSSYYNNPENIASKNKPQGVGGGKLWEKQIHLKNPYMYNWTKGNEGQVIINLAEQVLGAEETRRLSRGIKSGNTEKAEKAFARLEFSLKRKLSSKHDGIVLYIKPRGEDKSDIMLQQIFHFNSNKSSKKIKHKSTNNVKTLEKHLEQKYNVDLNLMFHEEKKSISLSKIAVPKENRKSGTGTKVMKELQTYADNNDLKITLSPSKDFGGSVPKLKKWYKGLGFVENKGKNKDFQFQDSYLRNPKRK